MTKRVNLHLFALLAFVNSVIFFLLWHGAGPEGLDNGRLLDWGANFAPLTLTGESWRLLTSAFLHGSWMHLLLNMYMLILLGDVLERVVGSLRFAVIYLLSALGGSLLSAFWYGYHETSGLKYAFGALLPTSSIHPVVSVGASGALMGLAGAAGAWALSQSPDHTSDDGVRIRGGAILQVIAINLISGFITSGVDQAAHVGGVIVGFAAGLLLYPYASSTAPLRRVGLPVVVGALGSVAMTWAAWHGGSAELLKWKSELATQRAQDAAERAAAHAKELAKQQAIEESKAIAKIVSEDERSKPAPVSAKEAAGTVIKLGNQPDHMVIGPSGKYLYVTDNADNTVRVVDIVARKVIRTIQGGPFNTGLGDCRDNYCRGRGATGIAISPDEHYAYVASIREDSLARIDLTKGVIVDAIELGRFPREVVASSVADKLYVLSFDDTVSVVSLTEWPKVLATLQLSDQGADPALAFGRPLMIWLSKDNQRLFTNSAGKNALLEFDTKTYRLVQEHAMDDRFADAMPATDGDGVWLDIYNDVLAWADPSTLTVRKTYPICGFGHMLASSNDGKFVATTAPSGSMVRVVKVATRRSVGAYPVPSLAPQVIFSEDNRTLYALNAYSDTSGTGSLSILDRDKTVDVDKAVDVSTDPEQADFLCPVSPDGATLSRASNEQ